jgi:hypothetical protein
VLAEFEVEGGAVIATASDRELCWQFVARHDLAVLILGHPLAGFNLLAHGFSDLTHFATATSVSFHFHSITGA